MGARPGPVVDWSQLLTERRSTSGASHSPAVSELTVREKSSWETRIRRRTRSARAPNPRFTSLPKEGTDGPVQKEVVAAWDAAHHVAALTLSPLSSLVSGLAQTKSPWGKMASLQSSNLRPSCLAMVFILTMPPSPRLRSGLETQVDHYLSSPVATTTASVTLRWLPVQQTAQSQTSMPTR